MKNFKVVTEQARIAFAKTSKLKRLIYGLDILYETGGVKDVESEFTMKQDDFERLSAREILKLSENCRKDLGKLEAEAKAFYGFGGKNAE